MIPRRLLVTAGVLLVAGVLVLAARIVLAPPEDVPHPDVVEAIEVRGPNRVPAGESFAVDVEASGAGPVHLSVIGAGALAELRGDGPQVRFEVPVEATTQAGVVALVARTAAGVGSTTVVIEPGAAVDPVVPLVGPRSIVADTQHRAMVVALPLDRWGNPVADDTTVTVQTRRPDGGLQAFVGVVRRLLAEVTFDSTTLAGRTEIWIRVGSASGPRRTLAEVAGPPVSVVVDVAAVPGVTADGWSRVEATTRTLVDQFGNVLPDGTMVRFTHVGPEGRGVVVAEVIDGRARARIVAPDRPGVVSILAEAAGVASAPVEVSFGAVTAAVPLEVIRQDDGGLVVVVGPVLGREGGFVPDGTVATVTVEVGGEVLRRRIALVDGTGRIEVVAAGEAVVTADVGGTTSVRRSEASR